MKRFVIIFLLSLVSCSKNFEKNLIYIGEEIITYDETSNILKCGETTINVPNKKNPFNYNLIKYIKQETCYNINNDSMIGCEYNGLYNTFPFSNKNAFLNIMVHDGLIRRIYTVSKNEPYTIIKQGPDHDNFKITKGSIIKIHPKNGGAPYVRLFDGKDTEECVNLINLIGQCRIGVITNPNYGIHIKDDEDKNEGKPITLENDKDGKLMLKYGNISVPWDGKTNLKHILNQNKINITKGSIIKIYPENRGAPYVRLFDGTNTQECLDLISKYKIYKIEIIESDYGIYIEDSKGNQDPITLENSQNCELMLKYGNISVPWDGKTNLEYILNLTKGIMKITKDSKIEFNDNEKNQDKSFILQQFDRDNVKQCLQLISNNQIKSITILPKGLYLEGKKIEHIKKESLLKYGNHNITYNGANDHLFFYYNVHIEQGDEITTLDGRLFEYGDGNLQKMGLIDLIASSKIFCIMSKTGKCKYLNRSLIDKFNVYRGNFKYVQFNSDDDYSSFRFTDKYKGSDLKHYPNNTLLKVLPMLRCLDNFTYKKSIFLSLCASTIAFPLLLHFSVLPTFPLSNVLWGAACYAFPLILIFLCTKAIRYSCKKKLYKFQKK